MANSYNQFLETHMYEYIKPHYPENFMVFEYKIGKMRADIVFFDSLGNNVALFELKVSRGDLDLTKEKGVVHLLKFKEIINIPLYLIIADADEYGVVNYLTYKLGENDKLEEMQSLPSYEILITGSKVRALVDEKGKREKQISSIQFFSWAIFVVGIILLFLDAFKIYEITPNRMIFMLGLVLIFLTPNITELTIGNINLKMLQKEDKKDKE